MNKNFSSQQSSWQKVATWYDSMVGYDGHFFHKEVILPYLKKLQQKIELDTSSRILDVACGQGVLSRHFGPKYSYQGVDIANDLIQYAKDKNTYDHHEFSCFDVTEKMPTIKEQFTHSFCLLAFQNISEPRKMLHLLRQRLVDGGVFVMVLNHPCFRIPRQSSWIVDEKKKMQSRKMDHYLSPLSIPIQMNYKGEKQVTLSHHHSISSISHMLHDMGFATLFMDELISPKVSQGKMAKAENRAREEFPLFLSWVTRLQKTNR